MAEHDDERRARERLLAGEFQRAYAEALLAGLPREAEAVIGEAIEAGLRQEVIDDDVIAPALRVVGDLWADGHLTIAEEHLATSISLRVLTLQRDAFRQARERVGQRVVLSGAPGEQHVVGLQMAASLILSAGYDVRLLGADLPVAEIGTVVGRHEPAVFGFTTAMAVTAMHLPDAFAAIRSVAPDVGIVVGGRAVDAAWATAWDVVICPHVADAVPQVDALVRRARRN